MVNDQWKSRFEEIFHEINGLESPRLIRKRELSLIVLKQLEEELPDRVTHTQEYGGFSFDEELFKVIFEDLKCNKYS